MKKRRGAISECGSLYCLEYLLNRQSRIMQEHRDLADAKWNEFKNSAGNMKIHAEWNVLYDAWFEQYKANYKLLDRLFGN